MSYRQTYLIVRKYGHDFPRARYAQGVLAIAMRDDEAAAQAHAIQDNAADRKAVQP